MKQAVIALAALGAVLTSACSKETEAAKAPAPPPGVVVTAVMQQDEPIVREWIGTSEGDVNAEIRPKVDGYLLRRVYTEGSYVRQGQLLFEIDPRQAQASMQQAQANLAQAEASLAKANRDVARYEPLAQQHAISQQELDNARSAQAAARSQIEAARAVVDKATLDLGYTRVLSPIDGLIGVTQVKPGTLVGRGESTLLTTISQIDPILFRVGISEADYLRLARRYPNRTGTTPAVGGIELTLADGTVHPSRGRVYAVDRAVNPTTGTLGIQMLFPNKALTLRPGQFGRVRALVDTRRNALLVPQRAVQELQNLYSVAVVGDDNKVTFRNVTVGPRVDDLWVIEQGIEPGDKVVTAGVQAIGEGTLVRAKPAAPGGPSAPPGAREPEAAATTGVK